MQWLSLKHIKIFGSTHKLFPIRQPLLAIVQAGQGHSVVMCPVPRGVFMSCVCLFVFMVAIGYVC